MGDTSTEGRAWSHGYDSGYAEGHRQGYQDGLGSVRKSSPVFNRDVIITRQVALSNAVKYTAPHTGHLNVVDVLSVAEKFERWLRGEPGT